MKFEKRIEFLESHFLKEEIDPKLDAEITEWFKSHPEYNPCAQPESNYCYARTLKSCLSAPHKECIYDKKVFTKLV